MLFEWIFLVTNVSLVDTGKSKRDQSLGEAENGRSESGFDAAEGRRLTEIANTADKIAGRRTKMKEIWT